MKKNSNILKKALGIVGAALKGQFRRNGDNSRNFMDIKRNKRF